MGNAYGKTHTALVVHALDVAYGFSVRLRIEKERRENIGHVANDFDARNFNIFACRWERCLKQG
jgi:transcription initiation factor TFIID subunit TAF12